MSKFACYCDVGVMAQCVAESAGEQQACHFSEQSANGNRCMHLNTSLNNHCWNTKAHDYFHQHGIVRWEDVEAEDEIDLLYDESEELGLNEAPRRTCKNCVSYTSCSKLVALAIAASAHGGVTDQDLWNHGSACESFIGETQISISGGV